MKKLIALMVSALLLTPIGVLAQDSKGKDQQAIRTAFAGESLTVSSSVIKFTSATVFPTTPADWNTFQRFASRADCTVSVDAIRYRMDGVDPTATNGLLVAAGQTVTIYGTQNIKNFEMIRVTTDATVFCQYSR